MIPIKLIEIIIVWVYYNNPFGFSFFGTFLSTFSTFETTIRRRITDKSSLPEMRIWSIL